MAKKLTAAAVEKATADPARRREVPDGLLTGLYLVIQPSGLKSWAVRYRASGKPRKLTLGSYPALTLEEAREGAREALLAAGRGADPAAQKRVKKTTASETTIGSVVRRYLARDAQANRSWLETARLLGLRQVDKGVDPATFTPMAGGIVAKWGERQVNELRRGDIISLLDGIVDRGAPITANRTLAALRRMLNWCVERDVIDVSPASSLKAPSPEVSRDRVLSDGELRWAWLAADRLGYPFGPIVKLLILTGQRREEVGGMRRAEIEAAMWTIPAVRAKNNATHTVPLSPTSSGILKAVPTTGEFMFSTTGATSVSGWSKAKSTLCQLMLEIARAEIPNVEIPPWTLHDLRRTAASGMARVGVAVHVVERLLNHRSGSIRGIAAVYNRHDYWKERVAAAKAWDREVLRIVHGHESGNVVAFGR